MPRDLAQADAARAVVFAPLDGVGRGERVAQRLRDAILSGILRDGERLPSESETARRFGVAVVTAREALEALREQKLVQTRRGREGGSFVTFDRERAARLMDERVCGMSRGELRDFALYYAAIAGAAAEAAADRAGPEDLDRLAELEDGPAEESLGAARRAVGRFQLEVAALSQSPRLVRAELNLQVEAGSLLWLWLREPEGRVRSRQARAKILESLEQGPEQARAAAVAHIEAAADWLIEEKERLEAALGG